MRHRLLRNPRRRAIAALALASVTLAGTSCSDNVGRARNNCVGACDAPLDDEMARELFGPADPSDWTMFRNNPLRNGRAEGAVVGDEVELVWSRADFMVRDWTAVKPSGVVWGDSLYYPSDQGTLYAFDRMTGDVRWEVELIDRSPGIHGTPLVTASTVCVGTYAGFLHCLDRDSGEEIWKYKAGNVIGSSPLYLGDNAIYVSHETPARRGAEGGGYVTKNDPRDGSEIWASEPLGHWPHASVAAHPDERIIVVGANDGILRGYDADSGEERWSVDFERGDEEADIKTTAAISEPRRLAVLGTWDDHVHAVDLATGDVRWSYLAGSNMQGSPALDDRAGRVYQGTAGRKTLVALDLDTGEEIWTIDVGGRISSSPALSGDGSRLVVGTNDGTVIAVEAETGDVVWTFEADGPVSASPTLVGDMIYVAARFGSLYALRTHTTE